MATTAFILVKRDTKLYNLQCEVKAAVKAKLAAGDVFTLSAEGKVKEAGTLTVLPVWIESPNRFVRFEKYSPGEAKATATLYGDSILKLAPLDWEGLTFCADLATPADAPATDTPVGNAIDNASLLKASTNPFFYFLKALSTLQSV